MNIRQRITDNKILHEGILFSVSEEEIKAGDTYLAERNTGPKLLTCDYVNKDDNWISPKEMEYCYDTWECIKVVKME